MSLSNHCILIIIYYFIHDLHGLPSELFDNYMQQDAHEFLNYLLNTVADLLQGEVTVNVKGHWAGIISEETSNIKAISNFCTQENDIIINGLVTSSFL